KTTVFNAVTGIYEPTEGRVLFEEKPLVKPLAARTVVFALAVGLLTGLLFAILAVNIATLWKVTIRDNFSRNEPFPWGKALADAKNHFADRGNRAALGFGLGFLIGAAGTLVTWPRAPPT